MKKILIVISGILISLIRTANAHFGDDLYSHHYMMYPNSYGMFGGGIFMGVVPLLVILVLILLIILLIRKIKESERDVRRSK